MTHFDRSPINKITDCCFLFDLQTLIQNHVFPILHHCGIKRKAIFKNFHHSLMSLWNFIKLPPKQPRYERLRDLAQAKFCLLNLFMNTDKCPPQPLPTLEKIDVLLRVFLLNRKKIATQGQTWTSNPDLSLPNLSSLPLHYHNDPAEKFKYIN